jgi:hypothetical protein
VSLSPGATETLWALGLGARVAAVSDVCDFPPDVVARAKARRSFAASASWASSLDQAGGGSASTSVMPSRRESPTAAVAITGGSAVAAAWRAADTGGQATNGQPPPCMEFVVDEEVLARERPGLVVYEESEDSQGGGACDGAAAGDGASSAGSAGAMMPTGCCGMGQAVLEALVAVGLQTSCRVVCLRRRTLADVLDSMLVVSGGPAAPVLSRTATADACRHSTLVTAKPAVGQSELATAGVACAAC